MHDPVDFEKSSAAHDPVQSVVAEALEAGDIVDRSSHNERPLALAWRRFRKHRPGLAGLAILVMLYAMAILADFIAPYSFENEARELQWAAPNLHFSDENGFSCRPFVYPLRLHTSLTTFSEIKEEDRSQQLYVRFFGAGDSHWLFGVIPTETHLFQIDPLSPALMEQGYQARIYLMGADNSGRDIFSRICYGARVSMSIGLIGALFVLVIGLTVGGAMGFFGGRIDDLLYSFSQMIILLPGFYLLLMLRFAFPSNMDSQQVYFAIVLILSLVSWPSFAIVIRGMVKSIMQENYVHAAKAIGLRSPRIIARHVLPNTASYIIVSMTLRIPGYILGESGLSLLGLGIMEPKPSWGNMLQKAMGIVELNQHPWVLWPGVFIFLAVMAFNLVGDGLRDALDPRKLKT